jgi:ABC-type sugar transport system substrate-binding protein
MNVRVRAAAFVVLGVVQSQASAQVALSYASLTLEFFGTLDRADLEAVVKDAGLEIFQPGAPAEGSPDCGTPQMRPVRLLARKP